MLSLPSRTMRTQEPLDAQQNYKCTKAEKTRLAEFALEYGATASSICRSVMNRFLDLVEQRGYRVPETLLELFEESDARTAADLNEAKRRREERGAKSRATKKSNRKKSKK